MKLIPQPGDQIGGYEILRKLGAGGMGVVYEARKLPTQRLVALKVLSPAMTREKSRQRFLREAEAAARLKHPNIVAVYDIHSEEDFCYYAMEFVEGWPLSRVIRKLPTLKSAPESISQVMAIETDLAEEIDQDAETVTPGAERKPPPPTDKMEEYTRQEKIDTSSIVNNPSYIRQVATMMRDVARALDYAHGQGVIHRDIKPGNLLLDRTDTLHLVDFGLARILDEENITLSGELMGTPLYMSPEQVAAGRIGMDHRTDIYSLGVVMYHLLGLQPPYEAPSREALLRAIAVQPPGLLSSINPNIPRDLETIVHHAIEKDPGQRYDSGGELADDLDRWLNDRPIKVKRPGPLRRWWLNKSTAARRALQASAATLIAAAVAIYILLPTGIEPALKQAMRQAENHDYLSSILWHAEAVRQDPSNIESSAIHRSIVLNELPRLHYRFPISGTKACFDFSPLLDPARQLLVTGITDREIQVWDLSATSPIGKPYGTRLPNKWLSYNQAGTYFLSVMGNQQTDSAQLFKPQGQPVSPIWLPGMPLLRYIRMASEVGIVAFMSDAPSQDRHQSQTQPVYQVDVYSFKADAPPRRLISFESTQPVELSADGQFLAAVGPGDNLEVRNLLYQNEIVPTAFIRQPAGFAFSPATSDLAVADLAGSIILFDLITGNPLPMQFEMPIISVGQMRKRSTLAYMQFNADGTRLLVVGAEGEPESETGRSILLWDAQTGNRLFAVRGRRGARFSNDGSTLAIWDNDGVSFIKVTDPRRPINSITTPIRKLTESPVDKPLMQTREIDYRPVRMDNAGRRCICLGSSQASIWDIATGEHILRLPIPLNENSTAGLDPSGNYAFAFTAGPDTQGDLYVWDLRNLTERYPRVGPLPLVPQNVTISHKPFVAAYTRNNQGIEWRLIDPVSMKLMGTPISQADPNTIIKQWTVSESGNLLFAVNLDGLANVYNTATGREIAAWPMPSSATEVSAISPDGEIVAIAHNDMRVTLHRVIPKPPYTAMSQIGLLTGQPALMRFSQNGSLLAIADTQGRIIINLTGKTQRLYQKINTGRPVHDMSFCFDDTILTVGHNDGQAGLWSLNKGRCIARTDSVVGEVGPTLVAVRDQTGETAVPMLATACSNHIRIYSLPSVRENQPLQRLQPVGPPLESTKNIIALAFPLPESQDDKLAFDRLFAVTEGGAVRWYDLSCLQLSPQQWLQLIAARTGMRLNDQGEHTFIPREEWLTLHQQVKQMNQ
ncbi:MAG: protein kinase [Planctomycetota bacterium]|nr:MAG: protein kinase [Planctomycetota bacterium]